jgi:hypothetical protein
LIRRCEHLESLGAIVSSGSAVWRWSCYESLIPERFASLNPLIREILIKHRSDLYEDGNGRFLLAAIPPARPAGLAVHRVG